MVKVKLTKMSTVQAASTSLSNDVKEKTQNQKKKSKTESTAETIMVYKKII